MATPRQLGYFMPAEFERHHGCIMIWPVREGSWRNQAKLAKEKFVEIARHIAKSEKVYMLADALHFDEARRMLPSEIEVWKVENNDAWARDTASTFVVNQKKDLGGVDWKFNAWGGAVDGLYAHYQEDDALAKQCIDRLGARYFDAHPFVLEGGSIHVDGEGTAIVTETCLLSAGRNPNLSKEEIEKQLREYLGVEKVIWLPFGIFHDETNEHVDNVCAFVCPGEVVLAWCEDKDDPQYAMSQADALVLESERDARGRKIKVHRLPVPKKKVCIRRDELEGFSYEEGEQTREEGERLAASYVNFYISNGAVLLPQFQDENDQVAVKLLSELFPTREVIPIQAREILLGGGNIHCITQQIPQFQKG